MYRRTFYEVNYLNGLAHFKAPVAEDILLEILLKCLDKLDKACLDERLKI